MKKHILVLSMLVVLSLLLVGCGGGNREKEAIKAVVQSYDLSDLISSNEFGGNTTASTPANLSTTAVTAKYVPGYSEADKVVKTVTLTSDTTATAEVTINLPGDLELYNVYAEKIATKNASLKGKINYTLTKTEDEWSVTDFQMHIASTEDAPVISEVSYKPIPAVRGETIILTAKIANEANDPFIVFAVNRAAMLGTPMFDNGFFNDQAQGDSYYTGAMLIQPNAEVLTNIGVINAISWNSLLDQNSSIKLTIDTFTINVQ